MQALPSFPNAFDTAVLILSLNGVGGPQMATQPL